MKAVRESRSKINKPTTLALNNIKDVATTPEGAWYAHDNLKEILTKSGLINEPRYEKALDIFRENANFAELRQSGDAHWLGRIPLTEFQRVQEGLARASAAEINVEKPIVVDFAISKESYLIKAFSADGKPLDAFNEEKMNKLLLGWLASDKNLESEDEAAKYTVVNHNGVLYVFDKNQEDKIKKGLGGVPERADPEAMAKMFVDPKHGFAQYVQKAKDQAQVTVHEHDYAANVASQDQAAEPDQNAPAR
jgi:hypothetical protein